MPHRAGAKRMAQPIAGPRPQIVARRVRWRDALQRVCCRGPNRIRPSSPLSRQTIDYEYDHDNDFDFEFQAPVLRLVAKEYFLDKAAEFLSSFRACTTSEKNHA